jgi:hypothetical protein
VVGASEASRGDAAGAEGGEQVAAARTVSSDPPRDPDPAPASEALAGATPAAEPATDATPTQPDPASERESAPGTEETGGRKETGGTAVVETVDLEKLVRLWPAVLEQVRDSGSGLLSQILSAARPVAVNLEEAVLEVGFPASAAFNKRKAEATEARDRFADAVKTIVGERLRPVYVLLDTDETKAPAESALSEEELVELMRTEFDAEEYLPEPEAGEDEAQAKEA